MLTGRVTSGSGDLAERMRLRAEAYRRATNVQLHPGSLNVRLDRPWRLPRERLHLPAREAGVGVNLVPCRLLGADAFIFRTDKAEANPAEHLIVEILSTMHLRTAFALEDGQQVTIELD